MLQQSTIKFLKDLKKNNNKPWFDSHRDAYENAKQDYANLIEQVIAIHSKADPSIASLKAKDCMFRINRDIRFSKDKTPYKINFGASINRGGKKSIFSGYYFHCEPGGKSFAGGGLWAPMPPELKKVRQEIDYCYDEFKSIVGSKKFKKIYGDLYKEEDVSLVKVPQGFDKDNPAADYIKLKSFIAMTEISDLDILSKNLVKKISEAFEALYPLLQFINRAI